LCVYVVILLESLKKFHPLDRIFIMLYMLFYLKRRYVILYPCTVKPNHRAEGTEILSKSHNFTKVVLPCLRGSVRAEARVRARNNKCGRSDAKNLQCGWFSPGSFHSPLSKLTPTLRTHTINNVHSTESHNSIPLSVLLH